MAVILFGSCAVAGWLLTGAVRRYALDHQVLDIPNERSSHTRPVPRGGGLAIAAVVLGATAAGWLLGVVDGALAFAVGVGGGIVAAAGWIDDHVSLSAPIRAGTHALAAALALAALGGLPSLDAGVGRVPLGPLGAVVALVGIVWLTNLYNFMDGIDGLAGGQALTAGLTGGVLLLLAGDRGAAWVALAVAAAAAGFLVWNWAPARIFMGDVSSGMLGFVFAVLAVAGENRGSVPLLVWVLLLAVFLFDATVTVLRRMLRGERWYAAHRSHAYQRAVQAGCSHARVSSAVLGLNVLLGGAAWLAVREPRAVGPGLLAATALLTGLYLWVGRRRPMVPAPAPLRRG